MSEADYTYTINYQRPRRGVPAAYVPEISGPAAFIGPRFDTEQAATAWAEKYIAAKVAGLVQPTRPATAATAVPAVAVTPKRQHAPQIHRQAQNVATIMGLPAPRATNGCYYCGVPLRNGVCEDCG